MIRLLKSFHPLLILPLLFCFAAGAICIFLVYVENDRLQGWDEYLSQSLSNDVVRDLCSRNLLPPSIGDCQNQNLQVQLRSIPDIFRANVTSDASKDDVNRLFGGYLLDCKEDTLQLHSVHCQYQLSSYIVAIHFSVDTKKIISMDFLEP